MKHHSPPVHVGTHILDALATYRLTRLAIHDTITAGLREHIEHAAARTIDNPGLAAKAQTLLTCSWCSSAWIAAGVVTARRIAPHLWGPFAQLLAYSAVAGLLDER